MSPRGRPVSMPPSLSASGPISVTPRSSHPTDSCPAGRPVGDACARTPRVPSPSRRRRTFPLPVAPTRANVDERRLPAAATKEGPSP